MRIDYSEPRQSYTNTSIQNKPKPRKEPVSFGGKAIFIAIGITCFVAGYGTGWFFSQKAAKKAFQAASEQTSLETSAKQITQAQPQPTPAPAADGTTPPNAVPGQQTGTLPTPPLSFYKTLHSGQKSDVLGSGINNREEKNKSAPTAAAPADKTAAKPAAKTAANSFTVQVASFSLKSEAETMKNKLAAKGYNAGIVESNLGDKGTWYRVRVGSKLSQEAARELKGKFGREAIVIPD